MVLKYLCAPEGLHFPILDAGGSFADIQRVVEQRLVFGRVLLRPLPNWWEKHSLVFSLRDGFTLGKVLRQKKRNQMHIWYLLVFNYRKNIKDYVELSPLSAEFAVWEN